MAPTMKRYAVPAGEGTVLDVLDPHGWARLRAAPSGSLRCPEPGCAQRLTTVLHADGTRFLRNLPGEPDCGHGAHPMSAEHRWLQERLAGIARSLGQPATVEHRATFADVYLPDVRLALEVQRWPTDFAGRTLARRRLGADVIWLLRVPPGQPSTRLARALFHQPAVRLVVHQRGAWATELLPWADPASGADAVLSVHGTVARHDPAGDQLTTRPMDAAAFLAEVVSGARRWYPAERLEGTGLTHGAWVAGADLAAFPIPPRPWRQRVRQWWAARPA